MKCKCQDFVESFNGKRLGILKDDSCFEEIIPEKIPQNVLSYRKFKCKFCGRVKTSGIMIGGELPQ